MKFDPLLTSTWVLFKPEECKVCGLRQRLSYDVKFISHSGVFQTLMLASESCTGSPPFYLTSLAKVALKVKVKIMNLLG